MNTVRSTPLRDGERVETRKASAIFRRASIVRARTGFERLVGLALLAGSGAGNYLAFHNGTFAPPFDWGAAIFAGISLALLTALQWFYRPAIPADAWWFVKIVAWCAGLNWRYCASVVVGVGLTVWGAKTIFLPIFSRVLSAWVDADLLQPAAWGLLVVVSLVVEVIPENILVD